MKEGAGARRGGPDRHRRIRGPSSTPTSTSTTPWGTRSSGRREIWGHRRCAEELVGPDDERDARPGSPSATGARAGGRWPPAIEAAESRHRTRSSTTGEPQRGRAAGELRYLGRGHTDNDLVVTAAGRGGLVLAGDLVEEGAPPQFGDGYPLDWPADDGRGRWSWSTGGRRAGARGGGGPGVRARAQRAELARLVSVARTGHAKAARPRTSRRGCLLRGLRARGGRAGLPAAGGT